MDHAFKEHACLYPPPLIGLQIRQCQDIAPLPWITSICLMPAWQIRSRTVLLNSSWSHKETQSEASTLWHIIPLAASRLKTAYLEWRQQMHVWNDQHASCAHWILFRGMRTVECIIFCYLQTQNREGNCKINTRRQWPQALPYDPFLTELEEAWNLTFVLLFLRTKSTKSARLIANRLYDASLSAQAFINSSPAIALKCPARFAFSSMIMPGYVRITLQRAVTDYEASYRSECSNSWGKPGCLVLMKRRLIEFSTYGPPRSLPPEGLWCRASRKDLSERLAWRPQLKDSGSCKLCSTCM